MPKPSANGDANGVDGGEDDAAELNELGPDLIERHVIDDRHSQVWLCRIGPGLNVGYKRSIALQLGANERGAAAHEYRPSGQALVRWSSLRLIRRSDAECAGPESGCARDR